MLKFAMIALVVAACGAVEPDGPTTTTTPPEDTTTTMETTTTTQPGEQSNRVEQAIADLARRLEVDADEIEVTLEEEVTWPDGAIGCPEPGMSYTQALVPGYRIVLSVDGDDYNYHGATGSGPFLCERALFG